MRLRSIINANEDGIFARRIVLMAGTLLVVLSLADISSAQDQTPAEDKAGDRPNIIYIMLDDAGYNDFGRAGSPHLKTPNFDQLCREGIFFNNHYSGSAVCAPTRCVLMTGLHSGHCKRRDNKATTKKPMRNKGLVFLGPEDLTVAKHLQQTGYVTCGIGKWGLGNPRSDGTPDKQGFDHFFGYLDQVHAHNHYTDWLWNSGEKMEIAGNTDGKKTTYIHDVLETATLSFIKKHANQEKPFFLYLPYTLPHGSYVIPSSDPNLALYADQKWSDKVKNYAAMVSRADQTVGKVMKLLDELKIDDNTIVFYTSDNGPNREHARTLKSNMPFRGTKRQLTEGGLRAAMGVRWPGKIKPNQESDFVWSMIDIFPTLAEIAKTETPPGLDGVSVLPTLMGAQQAPIKSIYFEIHHPFQQAVRMGKWKGFRDGTKSKLKLYNLENDPHEDKDVSDTHESAVAQIEAIMMSQHIESEFYPDVETPKSTSRQKNKQRSKMIK